jgi:hypothetical protein
MSALAQASLDRRTAPRLRVADPLPAIIGRGAGLLVDLSERGAKIRHTATVVRGSTVRISFAWSGWRFSANAEVLASRVVSLGSSQNGGTTYESRMRFIAVSPENEDVLQRALEEIAGRDMRRWVANLRGWGDAPAPPPRAVSSYLRCRYLSMRWQKKVTPDVTQPEDGFVVPAETSEAEIATLCETYARVDEEGRHVLRLMAAAAVEAASAPAPASGRRSA